MKFLANANIEGPFESLVSIPAKLFACGQIVIHGVDESLPQFLNCRGLIRDEVLDELYLAV